nr:enteropeptidase [Hymenolepis microstoma]
MEMAESNKSVEIIRRRRSAVSVHSPQLPPPYPPRELLPRLPPPRELLPRLPPPRELLPRLPPPRLPPPRLPLPRLPPPRLLPPRRFLPRPYGTIDLGLTFRLLQRQRIRSQCGREYLVNQTNVFDKSKPFTHSWPWVAGLHKIYISTENKSVIAHSESTPFCTASIVNNEYLITAMHCLMGLDLPAPAILPKNKWFPPDSFLPYSIFVKVGGHYSRELSNRYRDVHLVESAYVFTEGLNYPMADIAVLKLRTPIFFFDGVRPICLPYVHTVLPVGTECFTVGLTKSTDTASPRDKLVEVTTPIRQVKDCQKMVKFARKTNHVCAGRKTEIADNVTSGGGMYCKIHPDDKQYYLIGVPTYDWTKTGLYASIPPLMRQIDVLIGLG